MGDDASDNSENRFEGEAAKSLEAFLRSADSEDLLSMADELRSLTQHPGWKVLVTLCETKAAAAERSMQNGILSVFRTGHGLRDQAPYLRAAGVADGLRQPVKVVDKVQRMAREVRAALGIEDGE